MHSRGLPVGRGCEQMAGTAAVAAVRAWARGEAEHPAERVDRHGTGGTGSKLPGQTQLVQSFVLDRKLGQFRKYKEEYLRTNLGLE